MVEGGQIMRTASLLAVLIVAAPVAAQQTADQPSPMEAYRQKVVTVYGDDPCPVAQSPDEVVVCARRPEEERYRLRTVEPVPGQRTEQGGTARVLGADSTRLAGGAGTCTTVGPNGVMGCTKGLNLLGLGAWLDSLISK
jgi:hypothetical protein